MQIAIINNNLTKLSNKTISEINTRMKIILIVIKNSNKDLMSLRKLSTISNNN